MRITLRSVEPGTRVIVQRLRGHGKIRRRLMDMGIIPGTEIEVQKTAPLGDPIEIKFKGYNLSLRLEEADIIEVEVLPQGHLEKTWELSRERQEEGRQRRLRRRFDWHRFHERLKE